ncbi:MAG: hypothetical protein GJ680_19990 [Alteromonadaceae bacterium]|nr:hypothetical protein [Alteromonadaceae bacterium]
MKILVIVGTQLRHKYFLATLAKHFPIAGIIHYERTLVQPPKLSASVFSEDDLEIEKKHLTNLQKSEETFFSDGANSFKSDSPHITVPDRKTLNSPETIQWVQKIDADVMIDYGSGIIESELMRVLPEWKINLHGGLSPFYKGSATLMWPFYMQQPELAGATFHLMSHKIDGGDILQHVRPTIKPEDKLTDIMCRCITQASDAAVKLLTKLEKNGKLDTYPQRGTGKLFLEKDYKPSCIGHIYRLAEGGMIKNYLDNKDKYDSLYKFVDQIND